MSKPEKIQRAGQRIVCNQYGRFMVCGIRCKKSAPAGPVSSAIEVHHLSTEEITFIEVSAQSASIADNPGVQDTIYNSHIRCVASGIAVNIQDQDVNGSALNMLTPGRGSGKIYEY